MQFRTLYREFLFRLVDLELLSPDAQGDANRLLGRFGAMLAFASLYLGLSAFLFDRRSVAVSTFRAISWSMEHFLISTTMLIVGLFAILSWDSTFPDRRDVLVLSPLPIRTRTFFFAKVAAVATGLALAIGVFNAGPGISWPIILSSERPGVFDIALPFLHRAFAAYWITMSAAGVFLFCAVLAAQGIAALLPRRIFLRVCGLLQLGAFCLFLSVYFLEPKLVTPEALAAPDHRSALAWLPDYWFFGLFHELNGTGTAETASLAWRAMAGLAAAIGITVCAYAFCYFRTIRKVLEEPDIAPSRHVFDLWPRFGTPIGIAIVEFSARALARSRQHRVILSFYLGFGFAILILISRSPGGRAQAPAALLPIVVSIMILCFWVAGTRVVFGIPLDLRANWIFRVTPVPGGAPCLSATRHALYLLALAPYTVGAAGWLFSILPWRIAAGHLIVLGFLGWTLVELCIYDFQKIPFTCSWLPGKSGKLFAFGGYSFLLLLALIKGAMLELSTFGNPLRYAEMVALLAAAAVAARWRTARRADAEEAVVTFEDQQDPVVTGLGLFRDGVMTIPSGTGGKDGGR